MVARVTEHRVFPVFALIGGNALLALGPWFVRHADTGPVSAGFWRVALAVPLLVLLARANGQVFAGLPRRTVLLVMAGGVFFGLDIASWHSGIELTRLANAALFGNSGSLILMVWGFVAARRMPVLREGLAVLAATSGAAILMGESLEVSTQTLIGDLLCVLAGLLYVGYLLILQDARRTLGSWSLLAWSSIGSAAVLLAIALALGEPVWPTQWWPVLGLMLSSQVLGQGLLVYSLRHFTPMVVGIALLCQPVVASIAGWLSFGEVLGPADLAGVVLVGLALVLAARK